MAGNQKLAPRLTVDPKKKWKRVNWDLHSAVGFWTLAFVIIWGVTGVYFAFPEPFRNAVGMFAPLEQMAPPPEKNDFPADDEVLPLSRLIAIAEQKIPGKVNGWIGLPHHEGETSAYVYRQDSYEAGAVVQAVEINAYTGEVVGVRNFHDPLLGDAILQLFGKLHFGNFGGVSLKIVWTIFKLFPAFLFVTGPLMWWNRVLSKRWKAALRQDHAPRRAVKLTLSHLSQGRNSDETAPNL